MITVEGLVGYAVIFGVLIYITYKIVQWFLWRPVRKIPNWAYKSLPRDMTKRYDTTRIIKGENFVYKVVNTTHGQGNWTEQCYKKKKYF